MYSAKKHGGNRLMMGDMPAQFAGNDEPDV
jgi:hypothetical protein